MEKKSKKSLRFNFAFNCDVKNDSNPTKIVEKLFSLLAFRFDYAFGALFSVLLFNVYVLVFLESEIKCVAFYFVVF